MLHNRVLRLAVTFAILLAFTAALTKVAHAQKNRKTGAAQKSASKKKSKTPVVKSAPRPKTEIVDAAMSEAKKSGRPVIVFGMSDTCHRCQAVKQGIASTPEFQLLLTQYVSTEIPFGGQEFGTVFRDIVTRDKSIPPAIGAPSVFIFTSKGETVYAGPNRENGIALDDEFKKHLITGIERNGGLRDPDASSDPSLAADLAKARKLISDNQAITAALLLAKHLSLASGSDEGAEREGPEQNDGQLAELVKLTGLQVAKSPAAGQLDSVVQELTEKAQPLIQAAVAMAKTDKAIVGAVRLAELNRAFANFPPLAPQFEPAWKEIEASSAIPQLREQAQTIDQARLAERTQGPSEAIPIYQTVVDSYPNTQAAKLSQLRITQLQTAKPSGSALSEK